MRPTAPIRREDASGCAKAQKNFTLFYPPHADATPGTPDVQTAACISMGRISPARIVRKRILSQKGR